MELLNSTTPWKNQSDRVSHVAAFPELRILSEYLYTGDRKIKPPSNCDHWEFSLRHILHFMRCVLFHAACWNLSIASLASASIFDGITRRFVYTCYLDVDTVYNRSYIDCTGTRLPRSPPTSLHARWSRIPDFNTAPSNKLFDQNFLCYNGISGALVLV